MTRSTPLHDTHAGAWLDADELVAIVFEATGECAAGEAVAGVGVASMAEAGVPLDADGRPLTEIIAWTDERAAEDAGAIDSAFDSRELFARTGLRAEAKYTLPRLRWLRRERAPEMRRMRRWAGVADLVALRLTGKLGTDGSLAGRTLAFDLRSRRWDVDLLALAGVDVAQMPSVVGAGTAVGTVAGAASAASGIPPGTPVCVAGHDHLVGAHGAGVTRPGHAANSMGTAEVALALTAEPMTTPQVLDSGLTAGLAAGSDAAYVLGNLPGSGRLDAWFASVFGISLADAAPQSRHVPSAITARPLLAGAGAPFRDPGAAASFAGLRADHGIGDLAQAMLEGASFQVRLTLEQLERVMATHLAEVTIFGGSTRNAAWMATKANVFPWPVRLSTTPEAVVLGAARIAARAAGDLVLPAGTEPVESDASLASVYEGSYQRYLALNRLDAWPRIGPAR